MIGRVFKIRKAGEASREYFINATSMARAVSATCERFKMKECLMFPWMIHDISNQKNMRLSDGSTNYFVSEVVDSKTIEHLYKKGKVMDATSWVLSRR